MEEIHQAASEVAGVVSVPPTLEAPTLERRHCGRCQRDFEGDPNLWFQTDWALCPACAEILLPRHPASGGRRAQP